MIICRSLHEIPPNLSRTVVTLGNFDGVHLGHRLIFSRLKESAAEIGGVSVVVTFIPHPLKVVPSNKSLKLITTYEEKEALIAASGVDLLIVIPFTAEFANMSANDFVRDVLVGILNIKRLIIGYDYTFGHNREGNPELLRFLGGDYSFAVEVLEPIGDGRIVYSSSNIRKMIEDGNVKGVVAILGRHFSLSGVVIHGHHRGKLLGFPTANLNTDKELVPLQGVYAVKVKVNNKLYNGACNIGNNPTFHDSQMVIEVFIFDFDGDLYGCQIRLFFIERLREEKTFSSAEELQEAINKDVIRCKEILDETDLIECYDVQEKV